MLTPAATTDSTSAARALPPTARFPRASATAAPGATKSEWEGSRQAVLVVAAATALPRRCRLLILTDATVDGYLAVRAAVPVAGAERFDAL